MLLSYDSIAQRLYTSVSLKFSVKCFLISKQVIHIQRICFPKDSEKSQKDSKDSQRQSQRVFAMSRGVLNIHGHLHESLAFACRNVYNVVLYGGETHFLVMTQNVEDLMEKASLSSPPILHEWFTPFFETDFR